MKFEVIKLYYNDMYTGWSPIAIKESERSGIYEEGYFVKVDGLYFMLGTALDSYCVDGD